jgi:hypothetical protein
MKENERNTDVSVAKLDDILSKNVKVKAGSGSSEEEESVPFIDDDSSEASGR